MANVLTAVLAAIAGGGLFRAFLNYYSADREMNVRMVEIAVGILSQEPKDNIAPIREWAGEVISKYAVVQPSDKSACHACQLQRRTLLRGLVGRPPNRESYSNPCS